MGEIILKYDILWGVEWRHVGNLKSRDYSSLWVRAIRWLALFKSLISQLPESYFAFSETFYGSSGDGLKLVEVCN